MAEKNVFQRLILIGVLVLFAALVLRDPSKTLRPGLDIAGGTALIFELNTAGAEDEYNLAEKVKEHLQRRVDPKGVYDLSWRVHGRNRIEVQMPLPPKDAKLRLENYRAALAALFEPEAEAGAPAPVHEITRGAIERACRAAGADRDATIDRLAQRNASDALTHTTGENAEAVRSAVEASVAERRELLTTAAQRYDELQVARAAFDAGADAEAEPAETQPTDTQPAEDIELALRSALEEFEDAVDQVLNTNLSRRRFQEVLDLDADSAVRQESLTDIKTSHPDLQHLIDDVVAAHGEWRSGRQFLDGPGDLKRLLRGSGRLEFRILAEPAPENVTKFDRLREQLTEQGVDKRPGDPYGWFKVDNPMQFFNLDSQAQLDDFRQGYRNHGTYVIEILGEDFYVLARADADSGLLHNQPGQRQWKLTRAMADRDQQGRWCVRFRLNPVGGQYFEKLTGDNIGKPLCILVDDIAYSAPNVNSAIRTDGEITGEFSLDKVTYLVRTMEGGTLPARLKDTPLSERTVGSSLGETNRDAAVRAGMMGGVAVVAVMLIYYLWTCGSIAVIALLLNVMMILAAMAMLHARITLVGIAGIILSVGMAVDANVLIFERMREERERGTSIRMIIKNGYDKALSTIFDSNITTLLTCIIIYYVGSEEVKGFGLTLGWGIVLNLFTSVFVTRTLFALLVKYNIIHDVKMLKLIGVPKIDWYAKRKYFLPISAGIVVLGLFLLYERGTKNVFDVEFLGGVAAEFATEPDTGLDDVSIHERLAEIGDEITEQSDLLASAEVSPIAGELGAFTVRVPGLTASRLAALVTEPFEAANLLERNGVQFRPDDEFVKLYVQSEDNVEQIAERVHKLAESAKDAGTNLGRATVNSILDTGDPDLDGRVWNLTTTVTNMRLVEHALMSSLGEDMEVQPRVSYVMAGDNGRPYPITDRLLESVIAGLPPGVSADVTDYLGGAAFHLTSLDPPQALDDIAARLDNMHFQPDFQDLPKRAFDVIGVETASTDAGDETLYSSVAVVTVDPEIRYSDDPDQWRSALADPEQRLIDTALSSEQTLRKVMQFKPQIADRSTRQASIALLLSWAMIIGYLWIRFGSPMYGTAGVAALIHDVLIALAFVGISGWLGGRDHPIGDALFITDFKINMTIVAALLTIIGYSINDTIVVFDRIRETRGRLGTVTPEIINASINQTLARTLMTSLTTLVILTIMYIFGGNSIRGFNYCMIIGIITGSYSSIAVASPLLMARFFGHEAAQSAKR